MKRAQGENKTDEGGRNVVVTPPQDLVRFLLKKPEYQPGTAKGNLNSVLQPRAFWVSQNALFIL